jgi:hypothetical protein
MRTVARKGTEHGRSKIDGHAMASNMQHWCSFKRQKTISENTLDLINTLPLFSLQTALQNRPRAISQNEIPLFSRLKPPANLPVMKKEAA